MKNLKLKMSVIALVLGFGTAMATTQHSFANRKWGKDPLTGVYTEVTGLSSPSGYDCTPSANVCTEEYPMDVDPNNQAGDDHDGIAQPTNQILGKFEL
jgi:hypothetical protein